MENSTSLNRVLLSEQIAGILSEAIVSREYAVGDKLPTESDLCEKFSVSRTVIREALNMLKQKGLVESRVARGTFVISNFEKGIGESVDMLLSSSETGNTDELLEFRGCVEPEFAALAAKKAGDEDLAEIGRYISEMEALLKHSAGRNNVELYAEQDMNFHIGVLKATKNNLMISVMMPIFEKIHRQQYQHLKLKSDAKFRSLEHHKKIFDALRNRDADMAGKMMREHISYVLDDFKSLKAKKE